MSHPGCVSPVLDLGDSIDSGRMYGIPLLMELRTERVVSYGVLCI